jgi:branched-chain amino acid aminotransferase
MTALADQVIHAAPDCADLTVYHNGEFLPGRLAAVSVWDHGLLYGDGVFEGIRLYGGCFFRIAEHIDRLYAGLGSLAIPIPFRAEREAIEICAEVVRRNRLEDAHVRLVVTRGIGRPGLDPSNCPTPTVLAMAYPMASNPARSPLSLVSSSVRRTGLGSVDAKIKSLNYLASVLAKYSALHAGADDALMLDPDGGVAEATGANVFAVRGNVICTPPTTYALEGITRRTVLELADSAGWPVDVRTLSCHDLYTADEVFLCGTAAEITPVATIDGRTIGTGTTGAVTARLADAYFACVHRRDEYRTPAAPTT